MTDEPNKLWKTADTKRGVGAPPKFETPDLLWAACVAYFEWSDSNPLQEERVGWYLGAPTVVNINKLRAYTQRALQIHLGITRETWQAWGRKDHDHRHVVKRVNEIIFEMKFTAAAADQLNPVLIARELGLADKQEHTSPDGSMTPTVIQRNIIRNKK